MRDLTKYGTRLASLPKGLAFEIADLALITCWAACHDLQTVVRLDHGATVGEDYEEVIAFQTRVSPLYRLIMWRNADAVFVQPLVGRGTQHKSVAEALEGLLANQCDIVTDITPTDWPVE
jgi:hypothetical protein